MSNTIQKNELVEFIEQFVKERGSFIIEWDGGNDDGCYYIRSCKGMLSYEEQQKYSLITEAIDRLHTFLGYGSFAGDFYTCGSVEYIKGAGILQGDNYCSYPNTETISLNKSDLRWGLSPIRLEIPEDIWFENVNIHTSQEFDVRFSFTIEGPVSDMHINLEKEIQDYLTNEYKNRVFECIKQNKEKYQDVNLCLSWEESTFLYNDFNLDKKKKVRYMEIDSMECSMEKEENTNIVINL
jgi:hypothetical protein